MLLTKNPFPGSTYREEDYPWFFGRANQIRELKRRICHDRFVILSSPPHAGKTSLVFGGVIPGLKEQGYKGLAGTRWRVAHFIPSENTVEQLTKAIARRNILHSDEKLSPTYQDGIRKILLKSDRGLIDAYEQSSSIQDHNLLIVLDQCEAFFEKEVDDDKKHLMNLLLTASQDMMVPIYILMIVRNTSVAKLEKYDALQQPTDEGSFRLHLMSPRDLSTAIRGPVEKAGVVIDDELCNKLLDQLYEDSRQLSTLQSIMFQLWKIWYQVDKGKGPISMKHYKRAIKDAKAADKAKEIEIKKRKEKIQIGGKPVDDPSLELEELELEEEIQEEVQPKVPEGRAEISEQLLINLSPKDQVLCMKMFKALTQRNKLTKGKLEKRPVMIEDMANITGAKADSVITLANLFKNSGEKIFLPYEESLYETLELIDASLAGEWPRLTNWIEQEGKDVNQFLAIANAANGKESLVGENLKRAVSWWEEFKPVAAWGNQYYYGFEIIESFINQYRKSPAPKPVASPPPPKPKPKPVSPPTPPPVQNQPAARPQRPKIKIKGKNRK